MGFGIGNRVRSKCGDRYGMSMGVPYSFGTKVHVVWMDTGDTESVEQSNIEHVPDNVKLTVRQFMTTAERKAIADAVPCKNCNHPRGNHRLLICLDCRTGDPDQCRQFIPQ
jgi:hypothetical protein